MKKLIDANVILRYLLHDNEEMFQIAKVIINEGAFTLPEILAEVSYVLKGVYEVDRGNIGKALLAMLDEIEIEEKAAMQEALRVYQQTSLDFVDCILVGRHRTLGDEVFSFDKKLNKALQSNN